MVKSNACDKQGDLRVVGPVIVPATSLMPLCLCGAALSLPVILSNVTLSNVTLSNVTLSLSKGCRRVVEAIFADSLYFLAL
jgi:hypothetical protein